MRQKKILQNRLPGGVCAWIFLGLLFLGGISGFAEEPGDVPQGAVTSAASTANAEDTGNTGNAGILKDEATVPVPLDGGKSEEPKTEVKPEEPKPERGVSVEETRSVPKSEPGEGVPLYLKRKDGKLIAVPGLGLEQVEEMLRKYGSESLGAGDATKVPDFVLHSLMADGVVEKNVLRMTVTFRMETFQDRPVRVPLRFDEGILLSVPGEPAGANAVTQEEKEKKPSDVPGEKLAETAAALQNGLRVERKYTGPGRLWVEYLENSGFVAWILGAGVHEMELTFLVPVQEGLDENELQIQFPYATSSELKIRIPQDRAEHAAMNLSLTGATTLQPAHFVADSSDAEKGSTLVSAMRLGGGFQLHWKVQRQQHTERSPSILEVEGLVVTSIGKDAIVYDARLKVLGKEDQTSTFRVRLPEKAELIPTSTPDYTVTAVSEKGAEGTTRPLAEVRLKNRLSGLTRVDIQAKRALDTGSATEWFDISGFEVLTAVRQSGYYAVRTTSGLHANWAASPGVRRFEELPISLESWQPAVADGGINPETTSVPEWDAVFEYVSQPSPLWTRIVTRTTRVNIEPSYVITVKRDEVLLEATWNCTIRGGKITWMDIDLGDWVFTSVGPDNLVAADALEVDASGRISVPFVQASGGHLTLTFRASRKIPEGETELSLQFPKRVPTSISSVVTTVTPAELIILSAADVELTPQTDTASRLIRQPVPSQGRWVTPETPEMLLYRCESEDAVFRAARNVHKRTVSVREYSRLEIYRQEYRVRQTFDYTVTYGSMNQLKFLLPEMNIEKLDIQVSAASVEAATSEGENAAPVQPATGSPAPLPGELPTLESPPAAKRPVIKVKPTADPTKKLLEADVLLPEERLGSFTVTISYAFPLERLQPETVSSREFLLASPLEGTVTENLLEVASEDSVQVLPPQTVNPDTPWEELGTFLASRQFYQDRDSGNRDRALIPCMLCRTAGVPNRILLGLDLKEVSAQDITIIDRYWLQTWLTGTTRQDRAVFLFPPIVDVPEQKLLSLPDDSGEETTVPARTFTIHLPQAASADEAEVWIDRQSVPMGTQIKRLSANSLQVVLPPTDRNIPRTVEIRYQFEEILPLEGNLHLEVPYVRDVTWIRGMYWQVVLPGNTHVLSSPSGFSMEYRWGWNQCFWGRVPIWEQPALERWSGAITGTPAPHRMSRYVFAGMGSRDTFATGATFYLVNRTTLVVVLAVVVFWLGVMFLYFSFMRKPVTLLLLLAVMGGFVLRAPDWALLGLQAISLGGVLLLVSMLFGLFRLTGSDSVYRVRQDEETTVVQSGRNVISVLDRDAKTVTYEQSLPVEPPDDPSTVIRNP
ncbi:MAG: hypothetical protein Q4D98_09090 [Planctomycetia bacterium]|nr:hypothetical protein [Planctomycetia bacterium]